MRWKHIRPLQSFISHRMVLVKQCWIQRDLYHLVVVR